MNKLRDDIEDFNHFFMSAYGLKEYLIFLFITLSMLISGSDQNFFIMIALFWTSLERKVTFLVLFMFIE